MAMDSSSSSLPGLLYPNVGDFYPRKLGPKPDVVPSGVTERKINPLDKPDMVAVDVIGVKEPDFPVHRKKRDTDTYVLGTIQPFRKTQKSFFGKLAQEFLLVASERRSWKILLFGGLNIICIGCLIMWGKSTNSMALMAYSYLSLFHFFSLITCLISSWASMKKPTAAYSFGFERFEVLAVFATTVLVQLGTLFILKESMERFMEPPEVHTGRLLVGTFVALFFNLATLLSVKNKPFAHVSEAASTSCLQEHVADLSRSVCGLIPGLSSVLLPRMNPFFLVNMAGALALCITYTLLEIDNYSSVDTASAVAIALMTFGTMYPMSVYSGKVLLQTTPSYVIGQLDKLLREVSTLDGVLEVRNEHFWTVGFGSLAGSVHVRIRRDASEQMVLAHVTSRLHALVATLTVQIFKDDWIRPALATGVLPAHAPSPSDLRTLPPPSRNPPSLDVLTSTPAKPGCPPPEFSFHSPGQGVPPLLLPASQLHRPHSLGLDSRASPYGGVLGQGWTRPGSGLGAAVGRPSAPGYRTAYSAAPQTYGTHHQPGQLSQHRA